MPEPIGEDEVLYRRFTSDQCHADGRPTSFAFAPRKDEPEGLSAWEDLDGCMRDHEHFGVVSLKVGDVLSIGCSVTRDPSDPKHILIALPTGSRGKRTRKELALKATLVRAPRQDLPGGGEERPTSILDVED